MRSLYFDCFAGISGDMVLGALVDLGLEPEDLRSQLSALSVSGFELETGRADKAGLSAARVRVKAAPEHHHRHLSHIEKIIDASLLSEGVKQRSKGIFRNLAEAEARVHNISVDKIHFHEVGAVDAIVDIVGACIGFERLGIDRFFCSPLHVGSGFVEMAHGRFPVPPPAVAELLKGAPIYSTDIAGELVTPTGAAIVKTVCESFGPMPRMTVARTGYGAGGRDYKDFPNALRLIIGEISDQGAGIEKLIMLETNVDDMSPQVCGYVMEAALRLGALDCFVTPVQMKKNRPAVMVSILCKPENREEFEKLLFSETTTLGVRAYEVERRFLARETRSVDTRFGPVDVKIAHINGHTKVSAEYDHCRRIAEQHGVPLREVEAAALAAVDVEDKDQ